MHYFTDGDEMKITKVRFPEREYFKLPCMKRQIVLHHTVSSSGEFVDDWWQSDNGTQRVATAFIIDKDGSIVQLFEPENWAYHIGKGSSVKDNKQSIGIEIVNEGALQRQADGKTMLWMNGKKEYPGSYTALKQPWRGYSYFADYSERQYDTLSELITTLCGKFGIPKKVIASYLFSETYRQFEGVVSHHNLRKDKSDVSRAFDFGKLIGMEKVEVTTQPIL